jgi:hypothetical protein
VGVSRDTTSSIVGMTNVWLASTSRKAWLKARNTGTGAGVVFRSLARLNGNKAVLIMIVTEASFANLPGKCNDSSGDASSCWT